MRLPKANVYPKRPKMIPKALNRVCVVLCNYELAAITITVVVFFKSYHRQTEFSIYNTKSRHIDIIICPRVPYDASLVFSVVHKLIKCAPHWRWEGVSRPIPIRSQIGWGERRRTYLRIQFVGFAFHPSRRKQGPPNAN